MAFVQNSSHFISHDDSLFEVCVSVEGELEREVSINITSTQEGKFGTLLLPSLSLFLTTLFIYVIQSINATVRTCSIA